MMPPHAQSTSVFLAMFPPQLVGQGATVRGGQGPVDAEVADVVGDISSASITIRVVGFRRPLVVASV